MFLLQCFVLQTASLSGEGDLSRIEKLSSAPIFDGLQQHSMRHTGDKITDILRADQRGHGAAIGFAGTARGENLMLSTSQLRATDGLPDLTTAPRAKSE